MEAIALSKWILWIIAERWAKEKRAVNKWADTEIEQGAFSVKDNIAYEKCSYHSRW